MSKNRVTVKPALYAQFEQYASLFGQDTNQVIKEALADWMETMGEGRMEVAAKKAAKV